MLAMVIVNPRQVDNVMAEPLTFSGDCCAINVENCGESPATNAPHAIKKNANRDEGKLNMKIETRQHTADPINAYSATVKLPVLEEMMPPPAQPAKPLAIAKNDSNGTLNVSGWNVL